MLGGDYGKQVRQFCCTVCEAIGADPRCKANHKLPAGYHNIVDMADRLQ
jgi:hypothetical protein